MGELRIERNSGRAGIILESLSSETTCLRKMEFFRRLRKLSNSQKRSVSSPKKMKLKLYLPIARHLRGYLDLPRMILMGLRELKFKAHLTSKWHCQPTESPNFPIVKKINYLTITNHTGVRVVNMGTHRVLKRFSVGSERG